MPVNGDILRMSEKGEMVENNKILGKSPNLPKILNLGSIKLHIGKLCYQNAKKVERLTIKLNTDPRLLLPRITLVHI